MRTRMTLGAFLFTLVIAAQFAVAAPSRSASTEASHGQRAYTDAVQFARQHNLPHFTVRSGGVDRVVVNVPTNKIAEWCTLFSKERCYIEPFFNASNRNSPNWSMLRMGNKTNQRYGEGETYRTSTYSGRVAFPLSLSQEELSGTENTIKTSQNLPFNYNGGIWSGTGQNCTDWVTSKIGRYTGVSTASVKSHMSSLVTGYHSPRMTVMAVMTDQPLADFGQDQLRIQWH